MAVFSNEFGLFGSFEADVCDNSFVVSFIESAYLNFFYDFVIVKGDLIHFLIISASKVLNLASLLEVSELDRNPIHLVVTKRGIVFVGYYRSDS